MASIVLEDVDKIYPGGVHVVHSLDLDIRDGEFMVFVGPSGCGKSTALRMIAGLEDISGGTISIGGKVVNDVPPKDRDIAMVFQNYALYPHMSVEQNLAFGLQLRKTPKEEQNRRVQEAARMLGLEPFLKRKPSALSGGQRQRVAMGRAIVREPQAYLMDEPLSNLDAKLRVSMRASLNQIHERLGVTTIYVTHDQIEAMTLGDRVAVLKDGRLQQVDTPQHLFESPDNLFVAGFIGSPSMNMATAQLVRDNGPVLLFGGNRIPLPEDVVSRREGLDRYFGRDVIIGIRPSDFEDADVANQNGHPTITARALVTEELGSEVNVIFGLDAPPVRHQDAAALAHDGAMDEEEDATINIERDHIRWTARVSPQTRVRPGRDITLALDANAFHFFDPQSGLTIGSGSRRPASVRV